jgi:hypothetical protein
VDHRHSAPAGPAIAVRSEQTVRGTQQAPLTEKEYQEDLPGEPGRLAQGGGLSCIPPHASRPAYDHDVGGNARIHHYAGNDLYLAGTDVRQFFTDGRPWPTELEPTYQGFSISKWIDGTATASTCSRSKPATLGTSHLARDRDSSALRQ